MLLASKVIPNVDKGDPWQMNACHAKKNGQAVVEYAGAIAIAGLMVAAVLSTGSQGALASLFTTVLANVGNNF